MLTKDDLMKISEQKALEAYPMDEYEFDKAKKSNIERSRYAYIKGYDQAMQDFMEKAEDAISMISHHYVGEDYSFDQIWEQFKNYMQNE